MRLRLVCFLLLASATLQGRAQNLFAPQGDREDAVFLTAPRPLVRLLNEGEAALKEGRYSEGIEALAALLTSDNGDLPPDLAGQDFFIAPEKRGLYRQTIKGRAIELLAGLSADGRRVLELQLGVTARQQLDAALESRSIEGVATVLREFPHTQASYDAAALLAHEKLVRGHPLAAAVLYKQLWETEAARQRYGAPLAWATAVCWAHAGMPDRAEEVLVRAVREFPGDSLTVGGRQIALTETVDWRQVVHAIGNERSIRQADGATNDWLIAGGGATRSAPANVSMPLPNARWEQVLHGSLPEQELLMAAAQREAQADRVVLPRLEPLVVGNTVLAKTTDAEVLAIDLDTGLAKWAFYQNAAPAKLISLSSSVITGGLPDVAETLQSRVWSSSAFGRFTSDGLRFYYVTEENVSHAVGRRIGEGYNRLQGISIPAEGKILWQVGGPPDEIGDDPLAGAYFLGAPLPYGGELYCIAEVNGETRLVVLDAATGRLRWSQQLVHPLYRQLRYDPERKSQAITPIVVDGIVICPTGAGAVVAVDLQMRRLLWGVAYDADRGGNSMAPFRRGNLIYGGREFNPLAPSWLDPGCIVEGGVVAFSPPESHIFFCLDLLTGDMVLPPQRREDGRYLAAVRNGRVIVVGERRALALDIASQSVAWETGYPDRSRLAGRGLMTERGLLIPLSGGRLIRIDADNGEVLESTVVDRELGNLVVYRGNLLSLSAARIAAFYTRDYLQEEVERRLAANPQDTWALNQQAQVAMADGQIDRAFSLLNRSLELNPRDVDTRFLLAETVMQGMKKDFDKYCGEAARLRDFVDGAQRFRFLQWLALGSIQAGEHAAAFAHLVDLVHQRTGAMLSGISMRPMEMQIDDSYAVDTDAWLATQLARAYAHASPQQREQMDALVVREMEVSERLIAPLRRQVLRYFGWHAAAQPQTLETAIALLDAGDSIVAEQLLVPLALGPPSHGRTPARALLARPSTFDKTQFGPRGRIVPSIFGLDNGLDPTLPPDLRGGAEDWQPDWPTGRLIELSVAQDQNPFSVGLQVPVRFERFGRPEFQLRLSGDTLLVFNQNGEDVGHISIDRASADSSDVFVRAAVRGSLLILETSSEVMGIDLYRGLQTGQDALIWRQSLMNPTAGPRTPFGMPNPTPVNTSFGVQIFHRESNGRRILVGPLTNSTLVLQVGGTLMGLDPYTGHQVWSRSGFDDRIRLSHRGSEVAIVEPSMGRTVFIDARDGMVLREEKHAGYWEHWFSSGPWMVDYREQQTAAAGGAGIHSASTLRPTLLIWNPFDDAQRHVLELERGTRAGVLEDRYLVILQPTGNLQFWDLETGRHVAHQAEVDQDLNDILVQRFGGTLLILSRATSENPPSRVLNLDSISRDFHPVNGWVYALDVQTGKMLWDRPAGLFWMYYPKNQPRNSPYVAAYRIESTRSNLAFLTLVLLDLRNGELAYTARRMPVRSPSHCVMELRPVSHTISIAVGGRTFLLRATDEPTPPQPVAYFGKIGPARSSTHPFQSFDLFR